MGACIFNLIKNICRGSRNVTELFAFFNREENTAGNGGEELILLVGFVQKSWMEDFVGKGENAGNQHFLLLPQCLQEGSFLTTEEK